MLYTIKAILQSRLASRIGSTNHVEIASFVGNTSDSLTSHCLPTLCSLHRLKYKYTNGNNRHHRLKFNHNSKTKKELMRYQKKQKKNLRNINRPMPIKNNWCPHCYNSTQSRGSNKRQTQIEKPRFWIRNLTKKPKARI